MRKTLIVILCIVLVLAILAGVAWYFLIHQRDMTAERCADLAAQALRSGRYSRAIRLYSTAYELDPANYDLAISLANTVGNIDSDYYGADNEGHIMVKLRMETAGGEPRTFEAGTAVCQGVFVPFGITEDDSATEKRTGGFGSTGK